MWRTLLTHKTRMLALLAAPALIVPLAALTATSAAGLPQATTAPKCTTAHLRVWLGIPGDGAAGSKYYQMEFTNIGATTCTLRGFPGVSGWKDGHIVGSPASWQRAAAVTTVTLRPGATAHTVLRVVNVGAYDQSRCKPVTAGIRVFPPNNTVATVIDDFQIRACSVVGTHYLDVWYPIKAGVGIPGLS